MKINDTRISGSISTVKDIKSGKYFTIGSDLFLKLKGGSTPLSVSTLCIGNSVVQSISTDAVCLPVEVDIDTIDLIVEKVATVGNIKFTKAQTRICSLLGMEHGDAIVIRDELVVAASDSFGVKTFVSLSKGCIVNNWDKQSLHKAQKIVFNIL